MVIRLSKVIHYLQSDIWKVRKGDVPRSKWRLIRPLRILVLTFRGLTEDRAHLRASALTYYSSLSLIPVVSMAFGIAKGFGFQRSLEAFILEKMEGQEQVAAKIVEFAQTALENVKGGLVAGIGMLFLFYTIVKILSHIEDAFNDVWGIKRGRSIGRKISDYLSLMLIGPILFAMSSAMTVVITSGIKLAINKITILRIVSPAIFFSLRFLPYAMFWVLFTFLYMFIPNTRVRFRSGIVAGIIAGTIYHIFQWGYINFQIGMSQYNAIYGSLAALPLFFIWLYYSWLIVLFGAEISFAHQEADKYEFEQESIHASHAFKRLLSLRIVHLMVHHFAEGGKPWDVHQISEKVGTPIRLVKQVLHELVESGIVSEVRMADEKEVGYQPARDPDTLTIKSVIDALEQQGSDRIPLVHSKELQTLADSLKTFGELIEDSSANLHFKEI